TSSWTKSMHEGQRSDGCGSRARRRTAASVGEGIRSTAGGSERTPVRSSTYVAARLYWSDCVLVSRRRVHSGGAYSSVQPPLCVAVDPPGRGGVDQRRALIPGIGSGLMFRSSCDRAVSPLRGRPAL